MRARSPIEMDVDLHIVDVRKGSFYDGVVARLLIAALAQARDTGTGSRLPVSD